MKILIVYATAGAGHRKASEAIYKEAKKRGLDVAIVDILDFTHPAVKYLYSEGYLFLIKRAPFIWRILFSVTDKLRNNIFSRIAYLLNKHSYAKYLDFLEKEKVDLVISTHFMSSEITGYVKQKLNIRLVSVVTDFCLHSMWFNAFVDKYCVASDSVRERLVFLGAPGERIEFTGIPIDAAFSQNYERKEMAEKLGVSPDLFTLLVMTGEVGIGPIAEIIDSLKEDVQLLVVCGKNKQLLEELKKIGHRNLKIFGLVNNVYELMSVSDLVVTKPGGLTISEALSKTLPMIFFSIIPGQETGNARIIQEYGAGIIAQDVDSIKKAVLELKKSPEKLAEYKVNASRISHPDAAARILDISLK
ncbi:MAG: glycosyltransferase [Candidatus Omnitrophota bacterium]|nr:glycosyltransferase [Candidatus Omnitrophota bacterium]